MASTKQLLEDEIRKEIEEISNMELGSDNQKKTTDNLVKLLDKYNDMDRLDADLEKHDTEIEMKKAEHELKKQQLEHEKKDSFVKNCLTGISIGSGIIMTVWGTCVSINFEKEGTFSTIIGRQFIQRLLPKK